MRSLSFIFLIFASQVFGQVQNNSNEIEVIEVVGSSQRPSLSNFVLDRAYLEQQTSQLSDVLASLPGVQINQMAGIGNPVSVSIRGSNTRQVNLYIDGQLINSGQSGYFDLNQLPVSLIESVEVNQSQSSGSGPTPIGGEIRITTIRPDGNTNSASLSLGTLGFSQAEIKHSQKINNHQLLASLNYLKSDNNYDYLVPNPPENQNISEHQALKQNRFEKFTGFLSHDWQHKIGSSNLSLQYNTQKKQIPNFQFNSNNNNTKLESNKIQISNQQSLTSPWSAKQKIELDLSWSQLDETYFDRGNTNTNSVYGYQTTQSFIGFKLPFSFHNWSWQPFVNFDAQKFESDTLNLITGSPPSCNGVSACDMVAKRHNLNYGQKLAWFNTDLDLGFTWALSQVDSKNKTTDLLPTGHGVTDKDNDSFFSQQLTFQKHWQRHQFDIQLSRGIRQPTMFELFGDRGLVKGNDELKPESSKGISASLFSRFDSLTLQQTVFYRSVADNIVLIYTGNGIGSPANVSNVDLIGYSLNTNWQITTNWQVGSTFDLLMSNTESETTSFNDEQVPGVYHQEFELFATWQITDQIKLKAEHYLGNDLYYDRVNSFISDKEVTNLSATYEFNNYIFNARISNLFDTTYLDLRNRPAQGRQIQFNLTIKEF